jgi:hypothetical protein
MCVDSCVDFVCGIKIVLNLMCCILDFDVWGLCECNQIYFYELCVLLISITHYCYVIYAN